MCVLFKAIRLKFIRNNNDFKTCLVINLNIKLKFQEKKCYATVYQTRKQLSADCEICLFLFVVISVSSHGSYNLYSSWLLFSLRGRSVEHFPELKYGLEDFLTRF